MNQIFLSNFSIFSKMRFSISNIICSYFTICANIWSCFSAIFFCLYYTHQVMTLPIPTPAIKPTHVLAAFVISNISLVHDGSNSLMHPQNARITSNNINIFYHAWRPLIQNLLDWSHEMCQSKIHLSIKRSNY
jgi:hypothetical protein